MNIGSLHNGYIQIVYRTRVEFAKDAMNHGMLLLVSPFNGIFTVE